MNVNVYHRTAKSQYIRNNQLSQLVSDRFKYNIDCLDKHDFSYFLTEGRSLANIVEKIENEYDKEFKNVYNIYLFEELDMDDLVDYFNSRYNIQFQPYIDWVVRKEEGPYGEAHKRKENKKDTIEINE